MKWNRYLRGERVLLRRVETGDLDRIADWRNTPAIWCHFFNPLPIAQSDQKRWLETLLADPTRLLFVIADMATREAVGTIGLDRIDRRNQSAELGNMLIAEEALQGRGFAREAAGLLIDFAFSQFNLHRLYLHVYADNRRAVRLYRALGFSREGRLRDAIFHEGRFADLLLMGKVRGEGDE